MSTVTPFKTIFMDNPTQAAGLAQQPSVLTPLHMSARLLLPPPLTSLRLIWTASCPVGVSTQYKRRPSRRSSNIVSLSSRFVPFSPQSPLIHEGPPGTGKTHTAIHMLRLLCHVYKKENIPILATAYTNVAVDNLLEGLRACGIDALRLGRPVKVREELRDATLQARLALHPDWKRLEALREILHKMKVAILPASSDLIFFQGGQD